MPAYDYKCENGHVTEQLRRMADIDEPLACPVCGEPAKHIITTLRRPAVFCTHFPMEDKCAGIMVKQIPEAMKKFPHHRYNPKTGAMIYENTKHMERCRKDIGMVGATKRDME